MFLIWFAAGGCFAADPDWVFLENDLVRLGVKTNAGACIGFFGEARTGRNLLNHYDEGRFLQQSWYGNPDGSKWNTRPWVWNPVQGGSWKGERGVLREFRRSSATALYAKVTPRHWAAGTLLEDVVMEEWIELRGAVAHIRFRFTHHGATGHGATSQEMPAVFVDHALTNLVYYNGAKPWTRDTLVRRVPKWPNEHDSLTEPWAAYVDDRDWGIGVLSPGNERMTFYRHPGPAGPDGSGCSYFAPVRRLAVTPGFAHEYSVCLTIGALADIRKAFYEIHATMAGTTRIPPINQR